MSIWLGELRGLCDWEVSKAGDDGRGFGRDEDGFVCVAAFLILLDLGGLGVQLPANQMTMWGRLLGYLTNARGTRFARDNTIQLLGRTVS